MHSCGRAAWPPLPVERDGEAVGGRHHRAGADGEGADRDARHVVHAVDLLDAETVHHAVLDHLRAAAAALLGRLEDHDGRAVEVARLGEVLGRAEQHRRVAVVAAGMHDAGRPSTCRGRPSPPRSAARPCRRAGRSTLPELVAAALDHADDAGAADAGHDLVAAELSSLSATMPAVRWTSKRSSGCSWKSRRQAAISSARSATRLMTGMETESLARSIGEPEAPTQPARSAATRRGREAGGRSEAGTLDARWGWTGGPVRRLTCRSRGSAAQRLPASDKRPRPSGLPAENDRPCRTVPALLAALAATLLAAAAPAAAKTLRYANQGDLKSLDPYTLNETTTHRASRPRLRGPDQARQGSDDRARPGRALGDDRRRPALALPPAQGREVPERQRLHGRRRGLLRRPGAGAGLELPDPRADGRRSS